MLAYSEWRTKGEQLLKHARRKTILCIQIFWFEFLFDSIKAGISMEKEHWIITQ